MHRRAFLAAFSPHSPPDEFAVHLAQHLEHVWQLATAYFGCDPATISPATCKAHRGSLDRKRYDLARRSAAKLFDLRD